ncbi:hypothetical protein GQ457_15G016070 [Hibiscus cannabinus]
MGHVQLVYYYEPKYKKTWRGKDKAIRKLHGDWDASYNELPSWINIMQKYNTRTILDLETLPYYRNDRVDPVVQDGNRKTIPIAFALINLLAYCLPLKVWEVDSDLPKSNIATACDMLHQTTTGMNFYLIYLKKCWRN